MDNSKLLGLFILAACLLAGKQFGECRRNKTSKLHNGTLDSYRDGEGASRVSGGYQTSDVPPFLGTLWTRGPNGTDGKFAGTAIGLGGTNMIVHQDSYNRLRDTKDPVPPGVDKWFTDTLKTEPYLFPSPNKIDVMNQKLPVKDIRLGLASGSSLGESPFHALKVVEGAANLPNFAAPKLEHNKKEFGSDCKGYGYSSDPDNNSRMGNIRDFVSFPIKSRASDCNGGNCRLQTSHAGSCGDFGDHGMPVLCGPERKLTYLIKSRHVGEGAKGVCHGTFDAFHVPHMIDDLKEVPGVQLQG